LARPCWAPAVGAAAGRPRSCRRHRLRHRRPLRRHPQLRPVRV